MADKNPSPPSLANDRVRPVVSISGSTLIYTPNSAPNPGHILPSKRGISVGPGLQIRVEPKSGCLIPHPNRVRERERATMRLRSAVAEVENDQVSDRIMTRSASNQKKFANRRMTRSSFKQQQEQKEDEKPQQQNQQQQQQKKKRKREKKKMTPFADDPTKVIRTPNTGGKRYMRYFTPEEREAYHKRYIETEGFDMGKYSFEVTLSNPIREISLEKPSACSLDSLEGAKMAIRDYNRKNRTKYQFVKLVRVCLEFCTGIRYYITFQAKQNGKSPSPPRNFQACVKFFLGLHVEFWREEKKPNLTEGTGEPSQQ